MENDGGHDPADGLRQALRAATRAAHHRADHHPLLAPLLGRRVAAGAYGDALVALHALHAPLEARLAAFLPEAAPPLPCRARALAHDIARLGRLAETRAAIWPTWDGAGPDSRSAYVGMRYVLEGSAQGGRVIRRLLDSSLPAACRAATAFFDGPPEVGDDPWNGFWSLGAGADPAAAAAAARRLFDEALALWDAHFDRRQPGRRRADS